MVRLVEVSLRIVLFVELEGVGLEVVVLIEAEQL